MDAFGTDQNLETDRTSSEEILEDLEEYSGRIISSFRNDVNPGDQYSGEMIEFSGPIARDSGVLPVEGYLGFLGNEKYFLDADSEIGVVASEDLDESVLERATEEDIELRGRVEQVYEHVPMGFNDSVPVQRYSLRVIEAEGIQ